MFVGDRGMVKTAGKKALGAAGLQYISALTDPQIRKLLTDKTIQMETGKAAKAAVFWRA